MGHYESEAARTFATSSEEVAQLRTIHEDRSGIGKGRRDLEVLNKSGIVLLCAFWEAYCEDVVDQALNHLLDHLQNPSALPESLRKQIAKELRKEENELSPWWLAGDGWRAHLRTRMTALSQHRSRQWSNPSASKVDEWFKDALGIAKITDAWQWKTVNPRMARRRLNLIVALRNDIAHRGTTLKTVTKVRVTLALNHVRKVVDATDAKVASELKSMTGAEPFADAAPEKKGRGKPRRKDPVLVAASKS
jgi:hypothetical protein